MSHSKRKTYLWGAAGGAWNCPESEVNLTFSVGDQPRGSQEPFQRGNLSGAWGPWGSPEREVYP